MPSAEVTLPGATSSVPTARRFVESLLAAWGHPELGWTAAVCVSELAANCALHARTPFSVRVMLEGASARLEIRDGSPRMPSTRDYGDTATTGRGLRMVEELSTDWGVTLVDGGGKTVWVVLDEEQPADGGRADADADVSLDGLLAAFDDESDTPQVRTYALSRMSALPWAAAA